MLFQRRIKTGVRIKIAPMDEKELVLKKNSCSNKQKKKKEKSLSNYLRADYKASKHPEFVHNLVLKPWTIQMYSNYISFKKKSKSNRKLNYLHAGGGKVLASSSMFTSSELV